MTQFLLDPKIFNYAIVTLYGFAVVRWSLAHSWANAAYWLFALGITCIVTWGYRH